MATPSEIIDMVASLQNDTAQTEYTDAAVLPYLNMALDDLQETFELNNIPTTNKTSALINVTAGIDAIGFSTTPALPTGLIEIQQLWESPEGLNQWTKITKNTFIPHYLEDGTTISQFLIWAWVDQQIKLIAANADIDIKLDYIQSIFSTPILIGQIATDIPIINIKSYLGYKTAALCSMFIGENETRAMMLSGLADSALSKTLGIAIKGTQTIPIRRRPFRASFKRRNVAH